MDKPPIPKGTLSIHTHDGIYLTFHGTAPVFDKQFDNFWVTAWEKIESVREKARVQTEQETK